MAQTDTHGSRDAGADEGGDEENAAAVSAHESCPGRIVFTEDGNVDGWISTDTTVDVPE